MSKHLLDISCFPSAVAAAEADDPLATVPLGTTPEVAPDGPGVPPAGDDPAAAETFLAAAPWEAAFMSGTV